MENERLTAVFAVNGDSPDMIDDPEKLIFSHYHGPGFDFIFLGVGDTLKQYMVPAEHLLRFAKLYGSIGEHAIANIPTKEIERKDIERLAKNPEGRKKEIPELPK